jgi:hypothetical protein
MAYTELLDYIEISFTLKRGMILMSILVECLRYAPPAYRFTVCPVLRGFYLGPKQSSHYANHV